MKSKNKKIISSYDRARKKVDDIKGFYGHLAVYIIINGIVLFTSGKFIFTLLSKEALGNPEFLKGLDWNVYGIPILWGIGLFIHGLTVFTRNPFLGKAWEERQLKKYMNEE